MASITPDDLRKRFAEACLERDALIEASRPYREQRDDVRAQMLPLEAQIRDLNEKIKGSESGLFDLQNEIGMLNRALGGKTSAPIEQQPEEPAASPEQASDEAVN